MQKRHTYNTVQVMRMAEELVEASSNRYRITVQVANRAKKRRRHDEEFDDGGMKSVMQAIVEMRDELTQPEIIGD
jgi:DNA-directed RNA polymerase subunit omega